MIKPHLKNILLEAQIFSAASFLRREGHMAWKDTLRKLKTASGLLETLEGFHLSIQRRNIFFDTKIVRLQPCNKNLEAGWRFNINTRIITLLFQLYYEAA